MAHEKLPQSNKDQVLRQKSPPRRMSPRKHASMVKSSPRPADEKTPKRRMSPRKAVSDTSDTGDQVKLVPNKDLLVSRQGLRKACHTASKKKDNAAFHLMYSLLDQVFSLEEMAASRGTGLGRPKPGEEDKPLLDTGKMAILKEYVNSWCKKNVGHTFPDKNLNAAVTERSAYARKQLKKKTAQHSAVCDESDTSVV